jgi:hypothetical protein
MPTHSPYDRELSEAATDSQDHSPVSKRKSTASTNDSPANDGENGKKKRRKVNHACVYCRRSHMTCDLERPCARCVKRDIGHLCHDEPRDPPKRSKSDATVADIAPAPDGSDGISKQDMTGLNGGVPYSQAMGGVDGIVQPTPVSPTQLQRPMPNPAAHNPGNFLQNFDWNNNGVQNQFQDMHHLHPNYMFNTSEVTNEYNLLNDFLSTSLLDDGALYNPDNAEALFNDPLLATSSMNALQQLPQNPNAPAPNPLAGQPTLPLPTTTAQSQAKAGEEISRPNSAFPTMTTEQSRNKFYMTAADPAGLSSAEDRLHKLLKAKYEAGMLKPFNYVKGYARLNSYMSKHLSRESQIRILRQLDKFRPKFRDAMKNLTDMQLVMVEMWFERQLMEYDRVFASMAIPACCWRRTGEIFRGNREMAELVGVPWESLRDGKLAIHEIMEQDSLVSYWEKFGAIAFDQSQKAILTSCALKTNVWESLTHDGDTNTSGTISRSGGPTGAGAGVANVEKAKSVMQTPTTAVGTGAKDKRPAEIVKCCFSFTIRRDNHSM